MFATREYRDLLIAQAQVMKAINPPPGQPPTDHAVLAQLCNALVKLVDQKRIIRMRPKPKDVDVSKWQKQAKRVSESPFDEPVINVPSITNGQGVG